MNRHVFVVPQDLYRADIPPGYTCQLYIARLVGKLGTVSGTWKWETIPALVFEALDADDPTLWLLRYTAIGAAGEELARWENAGDLVGVVVAVKGSRLEMVMAINFTRNRWISTDYYPHRSDWSLSGKLSFDANRRLNGACSLLTLLLFWPAAALTVGGYYWCCAIPLSLFTYAIYNSARMRRPYRTVHSSEYRVATAQRIEAWISANRDALVHEGQSLSASL